MLLYNNVLILVTAEEFIGKDFRRSRNNHSPLQDPLLAESKATTWKVLCRESGLSVGSCYSCSVAIKCGAGGIVWGMLMPLLCLNQGPFRGVSTLTASFGGANDFAARERFVIVFFGKRFGRQSKCCYHRAFNQRYSVACVVATSRQTQNLSPDRSKAPNSQGRYSSV